MRGLPGHSARFVLVSLLATLPLVGADAATAAPIASSARTAIAATTTTAPAGYSGYSTGDGIYANAANLPPGDIAKASLGQGAAGVNTSGSLTIRDQLDQPLLSLSTAGKDAYGHGAGLNVGLLQASSAPPQVAESTAEAVSPPPEGPVNSSAVSIPASPLLTASLLPSSAQANTTSANTCVIGQPISTGTGTVATAQVLNTSGFTALATGGAVTSTSTTELVTPVTATGTKVGSGTAALLTQTVENIAPLTLFGGTPAALTIKVLAPLRLATEAGGLPGTSVVSYAFVGVGPTDPVVSISGGGQSTTLTSQQLFGNHGVVIALGVADLTIGAPAHSLTGLEGTSPTTTANGTFTSAAADFLRLTIPGSLSTPQQNPVGGPLAPVLNPVLNPVESALAPATSQIQSQLKAAGLNVADVRVAHLEAEAAAPAGGIACATPNPFSESYKDVSSLTAAPGSTFTYTVRFPNRGTQTATNVTVVDTYSGSPSLQFVSSVPAPTSQSGSTLTYDIGTVAPGQFVDIIMTFRIPASAPNGTEYHNQATISYTYAGQSGSVPVSVNGPTVTAPPAGSGCVLSNSTKYASNAQVMTGEDFAYFVNVLNSGAAPCTNVTVSDTLGSGVSFVSCSASCSHSGSTVTWNLGTISSGSSEVVSVVVKVTATSGTLPDTANITGTGPAGAPASASPSTPGPSVTGVTQGAPGVPAGCQVSGCPATASGAAAAGGVPSALAFTGLNSSVPITAGLLLLSGGGALVLLRRRRHS